MLAHFFDPFMQFAASCATKHNFLGLPTWYKYLDKTDVAGQCTVKFIFPQDISKIALVLIEILLRIAAMLAVGFIIYGGYRYILSQGEPDQANAARSTIINALIGLVIAVSATLIISFIFRSLATYQ